MDDVRWETLVRKLESRARAHPVAYRRRVMLLALVGYAFILGFIALLVAVAAAAVVAGIHGGGLLALKVLIVIGGLVWVVVRSLHVSFEPPGGVAITSADAPELFELLHSVQRLIGAPRLHRVLLDDRVNAGVVQIPRAAGLLGSQNYLVLGLPYLPALTPA